jgi:capsid protein
VLSGGAKKRRQAATWSKDEDAEVSTTERRKMRNMVLDQGRNFAVVSWAINQVLNYNTRFSFQSKTGDAGLDAEIERTVEVFSLANRFDVSGRMDRGLFLRVLYSCMLADGDSFAMKMANGALQGVEGDRIAWPTGGMVKDASGRPFKADDFSHGVRYGAAGRPESYLVCQREASGLLSYERLVPADRMLPFVLYRRFDQGRGVSPLTSALATAQDLYEANEAYALKSKLVAWAGMLIKRESKDDSVFKVAAQPSTTGGAEPTEYDIDMTGRPFILDLDPGDDIKLIESATPPGEWIAHAEMLTRMILISLDIPYTFYDQTKGSYTIQKDAWLQWEIASEPKRTMVRSWLNRWTYWQLSRAVAAGELTIPRRMTVAELSWEWQHAGRPWMDAKELQIDVDAIKMGLAAAPDVIKRMGNDPADIVAKNAAFYRDLKAAGLPTAEWDGKGAAAPAPETVPAPGDSNV